MVSSVASLKHLSAGRWPVASVRPKPESRSATTQAETEQAQTGRGTELRARRVEGKAALAPAAMGTLLHLQERLAASDSGDRVREALGDVLSHLADRPEHKKPKKPHPHDPPPPPPPPVVQPPVVVVRDDPAPARYLESVLAQIHDRPQSQFPDVPFSQRGEPKTSPQPAAPAGLGVFYTPGLFTPAQASAMRTVAQGQAGLALLQASQAQAYGFAQATSNPFWISTFA